jgi:hypothetical protein
MDRQFLTIPAVGATGERVFSFAGLTLSDLRKRLLEGTLEAIMGGKQEDAGGRKGRGKVVYQRFSGAKPTEPQDLKMRKFPIP